MVWHSKIAPKKKEVTYPEFLVRATSTFGGRGDRGGAAGGQRKLGDSVHWRSRAHAAKFFWWGARRTSLADAMGRHVGVRRCLARFVSSVLGLTHSHGGEGNVPAAFGTVGWFQGEAACNFDWLFDVEITLHFIFLSPKRKFAHFTIQRGVSLEEVSLKGEKPEMEKSEVFRRRIVGEENRWSIPACLLSLTCPSDVDLELRLRMHGKRPVVENQVDHNKWSCVSEFSMGLNKCGETLDVIFVFLSPPQFNPIFFVLSQMTFLCFFAGLFAIYFPECQNWWSVFFWKNFCSCFLGKNVAGFRQRFHKNTVFARLGLGFE